MKSSVKALKQKGGLSNSESLNCQTHCHKMLQMLKAEVRFNKLTEE